MDRNRLFGRIVIIAFVAGALAASYLWYQARTAKEVMKQVIAEGQIAKPALWLVKDADTRIYLFGSVHALPKDLQWLDGPVADAVNQSDQLVMELDNADAAAFSDPAIAKMARDQAVAPLAERVKPDLYPALKKRLGGTLANAEYDRMESWAVALDFNRHDSAGMGFDPKAGVETVIAPFFRAKSKPVTGLETVRYQLGLFNDLPAATQIAMLNQAVGDPTTKRAQAQQMINAWAKGDVERLSALLSAELAQSPGLAETLMYQRNRIWADWVDQRMDQPGQVLLVVGAGHLAGEQSFQDFLEKLGHSATRIQ